MIEKQSALKVQELSLQAISALTKALSIIKEQCSDEEYEVIKKGIGLSIGTIQVELLDVLNKYYPGIDDLS